MSFGVKTAFRLWRRCWYSENRTLALLIRFYYRDTLRAQKIKLDKTYTLPVLGILAMLPVEIIYDCP